jgi:hypothetical protein
MTPRTTSCTALLALLKPLDPGVPRAMEIVDARARVPGQVNRPSVKALLRSALQAWKRRQVGQ